MTMPVLAVLFMSSAPLYGLAGRSVATGRRTGRVGRSRRSSVVARHCAGQPGEPVPAQADRDLDDLVSVHLGVLIPPGAQAVVARFDGARDHFVGPLPRKTWRKPQHGR